jgi:CheY-like chemotaxis protein
MNQISILIIDDNAGDRYLLARDIKKAGFEVNIFEKENGETALEFFKDYEKNKELYPRDFPPNVVFLDINMPKLDGNQFLEEFALLRGELNARPSIFLMLSSSEQEEDKLKSLSYAFVKSYIVKGQLTPSELKEKINGGIAK